MVRRKIARQTVRICRRLLRGTRIRRLSITRYIHKIVYRFGCPTGGSDVTMVYRGLTLAGPTRDFSIVHQLFAGYYEEVEIALFERLATCSKLIIDVGANIGLYSCVGAANLPKGGHLVAFEPILENINYMRRNLTENSLLDKVSVEAAAVGETNGSVTIYLAEGIGHHSVAAENALGWSRSASVPVVSLDSYLADRAIGKPDLIKIDAEGYDGFVLRGARDTLKQAQPTLLIEYSPSGLQNCGFSTDEFLKIIFSNYRHVFVIHELEIRPYVRQEIVNLHTREGLVINILAVNNNDHLRIAQGEASCMKGQPRNIVNR